MMEMAKARQRYAHRKKDPTKSQNSNINFLVEKTTPKWNHKYRISLRSSFHAFIGFDGKFICTSNCHTLETTARIHNATEMFNKNQAANKENTYTQI